MELNRLREYVELVRFGNYSKAARYLNTSQSTLSKHIQALEKELGCTLVERGSRPLRATEEGRILFDTATEIINMYTECENRLVRARRKETLNVCGRANALPVRKLLEEFDRQYGNRFSIQLLDDGDYPLDVGILQNHFDAAFSPYPSEQSKIMSMLEFHHVARDRMLAILSSDSPLSANASVSLEELASMVFVRIANGFSTDPGWRVIEEHCVAHGFNPLNRTHFLSDGDVRLKEHEVLVIPQCETDPSAGPALPAGGILVPVRDEDAFMDIFLITKADEGKSEGARLLGKTARALFPDMGESR